MDKNNTRKIRTDTALEAADNAAMDEQTYEALFDAATDLAHQAFDDPTDDHIECVYLRLVGNQKWGLGYEGATTLH